MELLQPNSSPIKPEEPQEQKTIHFIPWTFEFITFRKAMKHLG
jgi:hypothetical protein